MRIRWTVPAANDLESIKNYLQQNYPQFAEPTVRTIYERIRLLKTSPNRGRPGHRSGTKELRSHRFLTSWSIPYALTLSKSCTSIMAHKIGADKPRRA